MTDKKDEHFIRLETMLTHQEQQINDLNEVVRAQWQEIERLKARLDRTQNKLLALQEDVEVAASKDGDKGMTVTEMAAAEKPPHY